MPVQITIIGLGQTGASIGLALAAHKDKVFTIGHDIDYGVEQRAKKMGAVEETNHNLPSALDQADLIILAIPVHQIKQTFRYIADDVKQHAVVVDLALVKSEVSKWAQEILPKHCHYVGLVPAVGPDYLDLKETGLDLAKPDLFSKSAFLLSTHPGTPGGAVKLVSGFVELLGSTAIITDFVESDGLVTYANLLPQLVSASLLSATVNQPGWQEVRKIASKDYFATTSALDDADSLSGLSLQNRENILRALNRMVDALVEIYDDIEKGNAESLKKNLHSAQQGRMDWLKERNMGDWLGLQKQTVEKTPIMERLFGSKLGKSARKEKES